MKFLDGQTTMALLEQLYNVPPLYHLDLEEFETYGKHMREHFRFFSPLHRRLVFEPLIAFEWLTEDRLVQRTVFGGDDRVELFANFRNTPFVSGEMVLPARSISLRGTDGTLSATYTPACP